MTRNNIEGMVSVLNGIGAGTVLYYCKDSNSVVPVCCDEEIPVHGIELPYRELVEKVAIRIFWKSLNKEERALAESFSERHGFFGFLEEVGFMANYNEAFELAVCRIMENWEANNDIKLNWEEISPF